MDLYFCQMTTVHCVLCVDKNAADALALAEVHLNWHSVHLLQVKQLALS